MSVDGISFSSQKHTTNVQVVGPQNQHRPKLSQISEQTPGIPHSPHTKLFDERAPLRVAMCLLRQELTGSAVERG
ncbi:hypothetical protein RRG08_052625 [Elysia crispata]|uniref:Uncharacterized protein n=1 Tax=Elysia crispata TaxID=231223 RepID=A0AAE1DY40_9GAST|nr:hypothetical protein RRG08_052625 [Elysia crispata]